MAAPAALLAAAGAAGCRRQGGGGQANPWFRPFTLWDVHTVARGWTQSLYVS